MRRRVEQFQAARWAEPLIMQLGTPGERGIVPPAPDEQIRKAAGKATARIPAALRRKSPPRLPEASQQTVLRHFTRLSQMTMGVDVTPDMMGTCTMKYSPKVNDHIARLPELADLHPLQDESTIQGLLEILYRMNRIMCEIAGMDEFTFQPASGAQGIYTNACLIRAYHASRGELDRRREIITTAFSHPADAATPAVAGFKVITLFPGEHGYPEVDALKAALSERTAGIMFTCPEDTGLFNPRLCEFVDLVHKAGGLAAYDQANGNGLLGIIRAGDAGFDMCQFNLHKTFSAPHGAIGLGCAAVGVKRHLAKFLPNPVIAFDGKSYRLEADRPEAIDKIRAYLGNVHTVLKAYAWVMSLGASGLKAVAETAVLNNNYLLAGIAKIRGASIPWPANPHHRLEQVRYSWEQLAKDTGVTSDQILVRMVDFGIQHYMTSHHPMLVPEPFTIEPGESYSLDELDECLEILGRISDEAYSQPALVKTAPHRAAVPRLDEAAVDDPAKWAFTWRAWERRHAVLAD
jgi:glycine dehydrogenase subunit 2